MPLGPIVNVKQGTVRELCTIVLVEFALDGISDCITVTVRKLRGRQLGTACWHQNEEQVCKNIGQAPQSRMARQVDITYEAKMR